MPEAQQADRDPGGPRSLTLDVIDRRRDEPADTAVRRTRSRWPWALAVAVIVLVSGLGLRRWLAISGSGGESTVPVVPILLRVHALGRLEPAGRVRSIAAPGSASAKVTRLEVDEGAEVAAGDVLAILDRRPVLEAAVAVAEARLQQAIARRELQLVVTEAARAELAAAHEAAIARVELDRTKLRRREGLEGRAAALESIEDARLELRSAEAALLEVEAQAARHAPQREGEALDVAVSTRDVELARRDVERALVDLDDAVVRAPAAGVVLRVLAREGESVAGRAILEPADTRQMFARMEVHGSDVQRVALGQVVVLTSPALGAPLRGEVVHTGDFVGQQTAVAALPAANTDARVVEVLVRLDPDSTSRSRSFVALEVRGELEP